MVMAESPLSHQAAQETLPFARCLRRFVLCLGWHVVRPSVLLLRQPGSVFATVTIIVIGNPIAALLIVLAFATP
jgi:CPA2 family monovalent cation:H+ antiporter-2